MLRREVQLGRSFSRLSVQPACTHYIDLPTDAGKPLRCDLWTAFAVLAVRANWINTAPFPFLSLLISMQNYARIGTFGILALVALRVGIGWHFYMEGVNKVRGNGFSSQGFLLAARGPLADGFRQMIWDGQGRFRLNQENVNAVFENATNQAANHFAFTDEQRRELSRVKSRYFGKDRNDRWVGKLNEIYASDEEDIFKYWESVSRIEQMQTPMWTKVSSLRGQKEKIESDIASSVSDSLASIDAVWKQYEGRLNSLATDAQLQQAGYFHFGRPGEGLLSTSYVDRIIPYFDMCVGILLMLGLLTPLAAWAAALFLISVVLSQMPGFPGTQPTYFEAVEALALIVLATTDAGRYAGLDFIPWTWWQNRRAETAAA